jgi:hypothetical protein
MQIQSQSSGLSSVNVSILTCILPSLTYIFRRLKIVYRLQSLCPFTSTYGGVQFHKATEVESTTRYLSDRVNFFNACIVTT